MSGNTNSDGKKRIRKFWETYKGWIVVVIGSVLLPIIFNVGSCYNQERIENLKRKSDLLKEFSQQFSRYLTTAEELFYQECVFGDTKPINEECSKFSQDDKQKTCQRMYIKKKILNLDQPDGMLEQIAVLYSDDSIKKLSKDLLSKINLLTQRLDCSSAQTDKDSGGFSKLVDESDKLYRMLLSRMAIEIRH